MKLSQENLELVKWAFLQGYRHGFDDSENGIYISEEQLAFQFTENANAPEFAQGDDSAQNQTVANLKLV